MSLKTPYLYEFDEFVLDTSERQLWRGDESIPMPLKAIETLCLLVENHGKLLSRDILMDALWKDTFVEERNLAQNIFTLRKKLGEDKDGMKFIETVPKLGYRFVAEVSEVATEIEETVEVSLEQKMTITTEGSLSREDLAEAIQASTVDLKPIDGELKRIESPPKTGFFSRISPLAVFAICALSLLTTGVGVWAWTNSSRSKIRAAKFDVARVTLEQITNSGQAWNPATSPDNKYITYVEHSGNSFDGIRLQNLETGSKTQVVSDTEAEFGSPVFSPDGNHIYYTARDGGREGSVYKIPILGGSRKKITDNAISDNAVSPDGKWLAFIRSENIAESSELVVCKTDGSDEKTLKRRAEPNGYKVWGISPSWSPDSKKIITAVFTHSKDENKNNSQYLIETDLETGHEERLKSLDFHQVEQPRYMPDGKSIVLLGKEKPNSPLQVWQIDYPGGKARKITNDLIDYSRLEVSKDGSYLLTNKRTNTSNISLIDSSSGQITDKLTNTTALRNGSQGLTWTPDGKQIVFSRISGNTGNIWKYDLENKKTSQITFDEGKYSMTPSVTPDGKSVMFSSNRSGNRQIWKVGIDGENLEQITKGDIVRTADISPDGKWLFYNQSGVLWKKALNGGERIEFSKLAERSIVSNDSKMVLFFYFDPDEKEKSQWKRGILPIEGSQPLTKVDVFAHMALDWSFDDSKIFYAKPTRNKSNIWIYSLADKTSRQLTDFDDKQIDFLDVSPDGKKIAIARGQSTSEVIKITGFN